MAAGELAGEIHTSSSRSSFCLSDVGKLLFRHARADSIDARTLQHASLKRLNKEALERLWVRFCGAPRGRFLVEEDVSFSFRRFLSCDDVLGVVLSFLGATRYASFNKHASFAGDGKGEERDVIAGRPVFFPRFSNGFIAVREDRVKESLVPFEDMVSVRASDSVFGEGPEECLSGRGKWCSRNRSRVPTWISFEVPYELRITAIELKSGNDEPGRDPRSIVMTNTSPRNGFKDSDVLVVDEQTVDFGYDRNSIIRIKVRDDAPRGSVFTLHMLGPRGGYDGTQLGGLKVYGFRYAQRPPDAFPLFDPIEPRRHEHWIPDEEMGESIPFEDMRSISSSGHIEHGPNGREGPEECLSDTGKWCSFSRDDDMAFIGFYLPYYFKVTAIELTSANDEPRRDPGAITLTGAHPSNGPLVDQILAHPELDFEAIRQSTIRIPANPDAPPTRAITLYMLGPRIGSDGIQLQNFRVFGYRQ